MSFSKILSSKRSSKFSTLYERKRGAECGSFSSVSNSDLQSTAYKQNEESLLQSTGGPQRVPQKVLFDGDSSLAGAAQDVNF